MHRPVSGFFKAGAALSGAADTLENVAIAGALLVRLRGKISANGTLRFRYLRPDNVTEYAAAPLPCADLAVVANTEFSQDINPGGESMLEIRWLAAAAVVTFLDAMQQ